MVAAAARARRGGAGGGARRRGRQRQPGDGARTARRRRGGEQEVDPAVGVASGDDVRRVDVDALDADPPFERAQLVDHDLDVAHLEQLGRRGVDHFDAARADRARDLERQPRPLLEGDDEVGAERRRAQLHRQAARHVAEPGRDRKAVEAEVDLAVASFGERRRRGGRIEAAAVEREAEVRLDLDLAFRRQRADERNRELELADTMRRRQRPVDEVDGAATDDDVVNGETRRFARRLARARCGGEVLQHVIEVVVAVAEPAHAQGRRIDVDRVDHRRQAQQRDDRGVGADALDLEHRRGVGARAGEHDVVQRELERPRIELDLAERQAPAELLRYGLLGSIGNERRRVEPGRAPEHDDSDDGGEHADPESPRTKARLGGSGRSRSHRAILPPS